MPLLSQNARGTKIPPGKRSSSVPEGVCVCVGGENVDYAAKISFYHGQNTLGAKADLGSFSRGDCGTANTLRFESPENSPRVPGGAEQQIGPIYLTWMRGGERRKKSLRKIDEKQQRLKIRMPGECLLSHQLSRCGG